MGGHIPTGFALVIYYSEKALKRLSNDKEFHNFKDDYIEKNDEIPINDKEYDYYFINNSIIISQQRQNQTPY